MGDKDFDNGIFGCFSDKRLCLLTFCFPCYTIGKNASEGLGEDCLLHGLVFGLGVNFGSVIRWRLREKEGIKGTMLVDGLLYALLPCCAMIQEAKQIGWASSDEFVSPKKADDAGAEVNQAMARE